MKRTKVFVTGMAAMALSFGLLMMGCDSGSGGGDDGIADVSIPTINVAAGDTALVVSTTGGTLKAGVGVFINAAGEAVTITTEATVQGSFKVTPAKVTQAGGKIIVTGLNAAAAGPANTATSIALKAGNGTVTVTIKADAQTDKVTGPAARVGKPAVIADNPAYKFGTTPGTDVIVFDPTDGLTYDINNATAAGSTGVAGTFDADLDAEIVKALTDLRNTGGYGAFLPGRDFDLSQEQSLYHCRHS